MRYFIFLLLLSGLITLSCSFEFRPDEVKANSFESYELEPGCNLQVSTTEAKATCSSGITVQVNIADGSITFENISITETETNTDCWTERVCTATYTGTATRKATAANAGNGRLSHVAGTWEGKLTLKTTCSKETASPSAPAWCNTTKDAIVYTHNATVTAHEAKITWTGDNSTSGNFTAQETKGGVTVGNTFYKRIGAASDGGPSGDISSLSEAGSSGG